VSHCEVTFCTSIRCGKETGSGRGGGGGEARTVQSNGDAFGQHMAVRAYENRHLAQRVQLEQLLMVLLVILVCVDDVQLEALRFRDG